MIEEISKRISHVFEMVCDLVFLINSKLLFDYVELSARYAVLTAVMRVFNKSSIYLPFSK
jgi:hypothetical protein